MPCSSISANKLNIIIVIPLAKKDFFSDFDDMYIIVVVGSSKIFKGKQKLGVTFNSDKLGGIDFTKFSKLTMCSVPRRKPRN
jgi:hypothetical protein